MDLPDTPDKDLPLRDDIRLLGRILGDTIRSQEGEPVFAIVERIRRSSVRFHRDEDEAARHELEATLNGLSPGQGIQIIRAFSYFSHLANIAEDPATGIAAGPMGAYAARYQVLPRQPLLRAVIEQGIEMGRPSRIEVEVKSDGDAITGIRIGGQAVIVGEGEIFW